MFDALLSDLRFALRSVWKRPGFAVTSILVLAIGISAVSVMFGTLNTVVLRPLPFEEPDRLIWAWSTNESRRSNSTSAVDYFDYREQCKSFESLAAYLIWRPSALLAGEGEPERIPYTLISHNFFATLGIQPQSGRSFLPEEEEAGARNVVIISHGFGQRRFGGVEGIIGSELTIDGRPYEVVGAMPAGFDFPQQVDFWFPMRREEDYTSGRGNRNFHLFGRLADQVTLEQAQAEASVIARRLAETYPEVDEGWGLRLELMHEVFYGEYRPAMLLLTGAVSLLLLITSANIGSLFMARTLARQSEIAVRFAVGASRFRVAAQLVTESIVIASLGGALGLLLAGAGARVVQLLGPPNLPRLDQIAIDVPVIVFTVLVSVLTGLLFGSLPALWGTRVGLAQALKEGGRSTQSSGGMKLRSILVTAQVALSLMLLVGSGLLIRSLVRLQNVPPGFHSERLLLADVQLPDAQYDTPEKTASFFAEMEQRFRALPGVVDVCGAEQLPLLSGGPWNYVYPAERPPQTPEDRMGAQRRRVTPGYFRTLGIPLLSGRSLEPIDRLGAPNVVVINETMANTFWPGEDALGKTLVLPWGDGIHMEVIGIAGDVREFGPASTFQSVFYPPHAQFPSSVLQIAVRTAVDPATITGTLRNALRELDRNVLIADFHTMDSRFSDRVAVPRFRTFLLGVFALIALVMASMGLSGVLAYFVSQRTHEIGIRMALGAQRNEILRLVLRNGLKIVLIGLGVGLVGAALATRLLSSFLYGVSQLDPFTYAGVSVALIAVALLACYFPARRATKVDPMVALRHE